MPGVDLAFDAIHYTNFPVVVLNLNAPSALLGFQLGGIVGHKFLSRYRVGIDSSTACCRLKSASAEARATQLRVARFLRSRSARRACASSHTRRSSSVSTSSGGTCTRAAVAVDRDEGQVRAAGQLPARRSASPPR